MGTNKDFFGLLTRKVFFVLFLMFSISLLGQDSIVSPKKNIFKDRVRFGGGIGLGIGSGFTNVSIAPSAIYDVNDYFSIGLGVQYSYVNQKDFYYSHIYGASLIGLFNPIQEVQLSAELEQLRVNATFANFSTKITDNFWNTALFLGAGYRTQNVTVGIRYNVLYKESNNVYSQAWLPFVRVYF